MSTAAAFCEAGLAHFRDGRHLDARACYPAGARNRCGAHRRPASHGAAVSPGTGNTTMPCSGSSARSSAHRSPNIWRASQRSCSNMGAATKPSTCSTRRSSFGLTTPSCGDSVATSSFSLRASIRPCRASSTRSGSIHIITTPCIRAGSSSTSSGGTRRRLPVLISATACSRTMPRRCGRAPGFSTA